MISVLTAQEQVEVVTGPSYADDVYYSLENGTVTTVTRNNWDLGFTTSNWSISILANNGSGVELYTYPAGDTADWSTLDTTGMVWSPMYNSIETLDEGAFTANAFSQFDYGWGTYDMSTHNITGDSLFVIKTVGGAWKKLAIITRASILNTWEFKYANLDGSDEQQILLNSGDYTDKSFVYWSIDSTKVVDREPAASDWDLLFTKYFDYTIPYSVTGVLLNEDHVLAQEVNADGLDQAAFVSWEETLFSDTLSLVGSDWKSFNMGSFKYEMDSTVVYFLKNYSKPDAEGNFLDSVYYKIYFTGFTGMSEGRYTFMQEKISTVSVDRPGQLQMVELFPNPVSDLVNMVFDHTGTTFIQIVDMTGRSVYANRYEAAGFTRLTMDMGYLNPGLYLLRMDAGDQTHILRFLKK